MTKYNHAYCLGFSVISEDPDGNDVTAAHLYNAIQERLDNLGDLEIIEACGAPVDTYEEDENA